MRKTIFLIALGLLSYISAIAQRVSIYQSGSYQPGLLNVRDLAASTEPGLTFYDYNYWNTSNGYFDRNGNEVTSLEIDFSPIIDPGFGSRTLYLDQILSGYSNVPFLFYASKLKILGARYIASFAPVILSSNSQAYIISSDTSVHVSGNSGGFGDLSFMPLGLCWSFNKKVDISFLYTVYAPTGRYKTGADNNIGKGYWTHQFQAPFYLYFLEQATALAIVPTFETNGKIKDADVRPGNRFTIEYGISQYITSWLELEILNGHNWQLSDDSGEDVWWKHSELFGKDQTSTFSVGVGVWPWEGRLAARVKYAMDYAVKQRYKSNFWSFSIVFIPNLLNDNGNSK